LWGNLSLMVIAWCRELCLLQNLYSDSRDRYESSVRIITFP
jgi:hypothetical protein